MLAEPVKVGLVVLAAGNSSRMGEPKQLKIFRGQTLLARSLEAALGSRCRPVVVVLGAVATEVDPQVEVVHNPRWAEGMGTSVALGTQTLSERGLDALVMATCDQPFVSSALFDELCAVYAERRPPIVASAYAGTVGIPSLFDRALFPEMASLSGAEGARGLLRRYRDRLLQVDFPAGARDIDTPEDWYALKQL